MGCGGKQPSWIVRILRFIEEGPAYAQWRLKDDFESHPDELSNLALELFLCPSRRGPANAVIPTITKTIQLPCGCPGGTQTFFGATAERRSSIGQIQQDGTVRLTTNEEGDGALAGRHKVISTQGFCPAKLDPCPVPLPRVPAKYFSYETSPFMVEVQPAANDFATVVDVK